MLHPSTKKLVDRLIEMTELGKLKWEEIDQDNVTYSTEGYSVTLQTAPNEIVITSRDGKELERATQAELADTLDGDGQSYAELVDTMRREAWRAARGTEAAISTLLAGINIDGDVEPQADEASKRPPLVAPPVTASEETVESGLGLTDETTVIATDEIVTEDGIATPDAMTGTPVSVAPTEYQATQEAEAVPATPETDDDDLVGAARATQDDASQTSAETPVSQNEAPEEGQIDETIDEPKMTAAVARLADEVNGRDKEPVSFPEAGALTAAAGGLAAAVALAEDGASDASTEPDVLQSQPVEAQETPAPIQPSASDSLLADTPPMTVEPVQEAPPEADPEPLAMTDSPAAATYAPTPNPEPASADLGAAEPGLGTTLSSTNVAAEIAASEIRVSEDTSADPYIPFGTTQSAPQDASETLVDTSVPDAISEFGVGDQDVPAPAEVTLAPADLETTPSESLQAPSLPASTLSLVDPGVRDETVAPADPMNDYEPVASSEPVASFETEAQPEPVAAEPPVPYAEPIDRDAPVAEVAAPQHDAIDDTTYRPEASLSNPLDAPDTPPQEVTSLADEASVEALSEAAPEAAAHAPNETVASIAAAEASPEPMEPARIAPEVSTPLNIASAEIDPPRSPTVAPTAEAPLAEPTTPANEPAPNISTQDGFVGTPTSSNLNTLNQNFSLSGIGAGFGLAPLATKIEASGTPGQVNPAAQPASHEKIIIDAVDEVPVTPVPETPKPPVSAAALSFPEDERPPEPVVAPQVDTPEPVTPPATEAVEAEDTMLKPRTRFNPWD